MKEKVVLIVDDNQAEVEVLKEAVHEVYPELTLHAVFNGEDCLAFLRHIGEWMDTVNPDLILLDLNLPGSDGRTILSNIKGDPKLCHIPVIILSTSAAEEDVRDTYCLFANSYVAKPLGYDDLKILVENLLHYWLLVAQIPESC